MANVSRLGHAIERLKSLAGTVPFSPSACREAIDGFLIEFRSLPAASALLEKHGDYLRDATCPGSSYWNARQKGVAFIKAMPNSDPKLSFKGVSEALGLNAGLKIIFQFGGASEILRQDQQISKADHSNIMRRWWLNELREERRWIKDILHKPTLFPDDPQKDEQARATLKAWFAVVEEIIATGEAQGADGCLLLLMKDDNSLAVESLLENDTEGHWGKQVARAAEFLVSQLPADRDEWVYWMAMEGKPWKWLRQNIPKQSTDWEPVGTDNSAKGIAVRYAKAHGLPLPPSRQPGRRKKSH